MSIRLARSIHRKGSPVSLILIISGLLIIAMLHSLIFVMWYSNKDLPFPLTIDFLGLIASIMFFVIVFSFSFLLKSVRTKEQIEKEAHFRLMYGNSPLGYQSLDCSGHLIEVNPAWLDILGYRRNEVIGKYFGDFLINDDKPLFEAGFAGFKIAGKVRGQRFNLASKDGRIVVGEFDGNVDYDKDGTFIRSHCVFRDITKSNQNEIEKALLAEKLNAKNDELQSLISSISHDLKTPLINIKGFTGEIERCSRQLYATMPEKDYNQHTEKLLNYDIPEALGFIAASTDKINKIINGLKDLSEIGTIQFKIDRLDMNRIVNNVLKSMEFQFRRADVSVSVGDLPECYGDSSAVGRVIMNILSNAAKYMSPQRKGEINIKGFCVNGHSEYHFIDNGIGIADKHMDEIFKPFRRINQIETDGEGLGLNIVHAILEKLNGSIRVESEKEHGSTFIVSLPRVMQN